MLFRLTYNIIFNWLQIQLHPSKNCRISLKIIVYYTDYSQFMIMTAIVERT